MISVLVAVAAMYLRMNFWVVDEITLLMTWVASSTSSTTTVSALPTRWYNFSEININR